jgi:hypothetical protein
MKRRKRFQVKYSINYASGKKWIDIKEVYALTEYGAIETIKWLKSSYNISIIEIISLGYVGDPIYKNCKVLGDF